MGWPDDEDLPITVDAAWGADVLADPGTWTWTDLTDRLRAVPITLRVGRSSGAAVVSPSTATITLANEDGALTPLSGMSPWWPYVDLGVPIRLRLLWGGTWHTLLAGFADSWSATVIPTTEPGVVESAVQVAISGVLRRNRQGQPPVRSAMRRATPVSAPVAYWPCEDGGDATQAASAISGHPPITVSGVVDFAELSIATPGGNAAVGSLPLPNLQHGGSLLATIPADATAACATEWAIQFVGEVESGSITGEMGLLEWTTPGGTYVRWRLVLFMSGSTLNWNLRAYNAAGAETHVNGGAGQQFGAWRITAVQSSGNIDVRMYLGSNLTDVQSLPGTLAGPAQITVNSTGTVATQPVPVGHITLWPTRTPTLPLRGDVVDPYGQRISPPDVLPWNTEAAHLRLARLAAEDGLAITAPPVSADLIVRMGPQPAGTPEELYAECVEADGGILYESGYGLGYLPRAARYNQSPTLTIDLAAYCVIAGDSARVLTPLLDDREARNEWQVERAGGSSAIAVNLEHQRRHGVRPDSVELNLTDDTTLADQAAWRVHLGTTQGLRDTTIPIDLAANPGLVAGWLACQVGSRIRRINAPVQAGPVDDRIIDGWTATIGPRKWIVQIATSPASPWDVAEADGEQRVAADGSSLATQLTATAMSMSIVSTATNGPWTTNPANFPLDIRVGGERAIANAITGSGLTQTVALAVRGVNGVQRAWAADTEVDATPPAIAPL